ncbi:hypothetical protein B0H11DRAFT_2050263 [Mycena galericulata]|nr:hypothetical protein B0H11DRAFT_2050263 [Mycena galericulata]
MVQLWKAETGEALGDPLEGHNGWVTSVAFSPDGRKIVSGSHDQTVRLWNVETREALSDSLLQSDPHQVTSDGKRIMLGSDTVSTNINPIVKWYLDGGWLLSNSHELLLWLPSPNREGFWTFNTHLVIGRRQTMISFQNSVHGREWKSCYIHQ